jgi:hypothetical protein
MISVVEGLPMSLAGGQQRGRDYSGADKREQNGCGSPWRRSFGDPCNADVTPGGLLYLQGSLFNFKALCVLFCMKHRVKADST